MKLSRHLVPLAYHCKVTGLVLLILERLLDGLLLLAVTIQNIVGSLVMECITQRWHDELA